MASDPKHSVLVLDDDEIILVALQETMACENYNLVTTTSAHQALKLVEEQSFAVIISDQRMAEMTGLDFFRKAKIIQPNASRILITGVLTLKTVIEAINSGEIYRFVAKPWLREELLATVSDAVKRFQMLEVNTKLQNDTLKLNQQLAETNSRLQKKVTELNEQKRILNKANEALSQNFEHSLELCYRIISAYHPLLGKETRAVVDLCLKMIEAGPLSVEEQHILKAGAWLHNIGLIGISRDVYLRAREDPDSLSDGEQQLIRNHPIYGQTLAAFVDHLQAVGLTIRAHHERWDGSGFPDCLIGDSIPRPARYLAVAVHFVECGLARDAAIEDILRQSGTAFEPEAVRLFLKATRMVQLPKKVREVLFSDLKPGMTLAKGLYSPTGLLLIPEGQALNDETMNKIKAHNQVDPINQRLLVYSG